MIATSVVAIVTAATRARLVPLHVLAGTPADVADGRVWLVVSNGFVADNPVVLSLVAFAAFAAAAGVVCGLRTLWVSAALGHVGSTVPVYLGLGAVALARPGAVDRVAHVRDYGVSAIIAAWLGALALVLWRRHPSRRLVVAGFCALCGIVGFFADTKPTPLDVDHVLAFAIGIACAAVAERGYAASSAQARATVTAWSRALVTALADARPRLAPSRERSRA